MPQVDTLRDEHGVRPVCHELDIAPSTWYRHQQHRQHPARRSQRAQRDDLLKVEIQRVYDENYSVYGVRRSKKVRTTVNWYNNSRLLELLGHIPPAEAEKAYYASIGNGDLAA